VFHHDFLWLGMLYALDYLTSNRFICGGIDICALAISHIILGLILLLSQMLLGQSVKFSLEPASLKHPGKR
jgi:hypothetical protein